MCLSVIFVYFKNKMLVRHFFLSFLGWRAGLSGLLVTVCDMGLVRFVLFNIKNLTATKLTWQFCGGRDSNQGESMRVKPEKGGKQKKNCDKISRLASNGNVVYPKISCCCFVICSGMMEWYRCSSVQHQGNSVTPWVAPMPRCTQKLTGQGQME